METVINRLIIYTRKIDEMIAFYSDHFGYSAHRQDDDRIVELRPPKGGLILMLHPASKGQKEGQVLLKLVVDVPDVPAFSDRLRSQGVAVGPLHQGDGYVFANLKDPSQNSVSLSSRAFARMSGRGV